MTWFLHIRLSLRNRTTLTIDLLARETNLCPWTLVRAPASTETASTTSLWLYNIGITIPWKRVISLARTMLSWPGGLNEQQIPPNNNGLFLRFSWVNAADMPTRYVLQARWESSAACRWGDENVDAERTGVGMGNRECRCGGYGAACLC